MLIRNLAWSFCRSALTQYRGGNTTLWWSKRFEHRARVKREPKRRATHAFSLIARSPPVRSPSRRKGARPILRVQRSHFTIHEVTHPLLPSSPLTSASFPVPLKELSPTPPGKSGGGREARNDSRWSRTYSRLLDVIGTEGMYITADGPLPWWTASTAWIISSFSPALTTEVANVPACHHAWSPGRTCGMLTIVLPSSKWGWVMSFNS